MPCTIAQKIDLCRLHDIAMASADPKPIPALVASDLAAIVQFLRSSEFPSCGPSENEGKGCSGMLAGRRGLNNSCRGLLRKIHPPQEVLEARAGGEWVDSPEAFPVG